MKNPNPMVIIWLDFSKSSIEMTFFNAKSGVFKPFSPLFVHASSSFLDPVKAGYHGFDRWRTRWSKGNIEILRFWGPLQGCIFQNIENLAFAL